MTEAGAQPLILLVEDSAAVLDAFSILLGESGYRVAQAATGADALRLAAELRPDLVLLDLGLPDMDGLDVARRLRSDPAVGDAPVVALTGRDISEQSVRDAGCTGLVGKPLGARELLEAVQGALG